MIVRARLLAFLEFNNNNNNDGYLERLTRTGPKRLDVFKCTYFQNSTHTTEHERARTHARARRERERDRQTDRQTATDRQTETDRQSCISRQVHHQY